MNSVLNLSMKSSSVAVRVCTMVVVDSGDLPLPICGSFVTLSSGLAPSDLKTLADGSVCVVVGTLLSVLFVCCLPVWFEFPGPSPRW